MNIQYTQFAWHKMTLLSILNPLDCTHDLCTLLVLLILLEKTEMDAVHAARQDGLPRFPWYEPHAIPHLLYPSCSSRFPVGSKDARHRGVHGGVVEATKSAMAA
jgi:hypothetical protein